MAIANLIPPGVSIPQVDSSWLSQLGGTLGGISENVRADRAFSGLADRIAGSPAAQAQQPSFLSRLTGGGQQQVAAAPSGPIGDDYFASIRSAESGGNDSAKNPGSSATGRYQFTKGTWDGLMTSHPELGLTSDGRLDPNQQERAIRQFTQDNASVLSRAGIPINPGNLYAAHFLGAGGASSVLGQGDDASVASIVGPDVVAANPFLDNMTVGQFKLWAAKKGGNASGGYSAPQNAADAANAMADGSLTAYADGPAPSSGQQAIQQQAAPNQVAQQGGGNIIAQGFTPVTRGSVDPNLIQYMLRDRNLRDVGLKLWAANAQGQRSEEPWQFVNLPDGTLARANQQTGAVERLGNFAKAPEPKSLINLGDGQLFDPNNREVIDAGGNRKKAPNIVELFDEATGQPYKAQWNDETGKFDRVGGVKARSGMSLTTNPDGTVTLTEGSVGGMPKLTDSEGRSTGFYGRGIESQKTLNSLESEGTSVWNNTAGQIPKVGNFLRTENAQKYDQAKRDFINAVLRRESGAVISPEEFANAEQQYFPQPGDGAEVIAQKRRNRDVTIQGLKVSSGQGANFALPPDQQGQQPAASKPGARKTSTGVQWSIEE